MGVLAYILAFALLTLGGRPASAEDGTWVLDCRGQAEVVGNTTRAMAMAEAQAQARLRALEKVAGIQVREQYLEITVNRGSGGGDLVQREMSAVTEGLVLDARNERWETPVVPAGPGEPAYIRVVYRADLKVAKAPRPDGSLGVKLELDKPVVVTGQAVVLSVRSTDDAYLTVFNLAADDKIYVVYPNKYSTEIKLKRGELLRIPRDEDPFDLRPLVVKGHREDLEVLKAIVTRSQIRPPEPGADGALTMIDFYRWLYALPPSQWAEAQVTYTVVGDHAR